MGNKINLYKYQKELIDNAKKKYMYITDTSTGKTLIGLYHYLKFKEPNEKLLIIAPSAKVKEKGWDKEIKKVEESENIKIEYDVKSYDTFSNEIKKLKPAYGREFIPYGNTFVIFDEGHMIKNRTSNRTKNIKKYLKKTGNDFIILTATPTPNGYKDYGSYLEMFGIVESAYAFEQTYGIFNPYLFKMKNIKVIEGWKNTDIIDKAYLSISSPPLKKNDCIDLPPLFEENVYFKKSSKYKKVDALFETSLAVKLKKNYLNNINENTYDDKHHNDVKSELLDLENTLDVYKNKILETKDKNIVDKYFKESIMHDLDTDAYVNTLFRTYGSPEDKISYLQNFLEGTTNNVIIFYNYKAELAFIMEMLEKLENQKQIFVVNGSEFKIPEDNLRDELQNSVTLVQIQAGSAGLELQYANEVIFFSPTYTYQDYYQAMGRAYRNGQKNKVTVYNYLTEKSFETKQVWTTLQNKQDFNQKMEKKALDVFKAERELREDKLRKKIWKKQ